MFIGVSRGDNINNANNSKRINIVNDKGSNDNAYIKMIIIKMKMIIIIKIRKDIL